MKFYSSPNPPMIICEPLVAYAMLITIKGQKISLDHEVKGVFLGDILMERRNGRFMIWTSASSL